MSLEKNLAKFIKQKGINLSMMAREIEIPYIQLYDSLFNKKKNRELRSSELIAVCKFLEVNPMDFAEQKEGE